jgi:hypothetical protein
VEVIGAVFFDDFWDVRGFEVDMEGAVGHIPRCVCYGSKNFLLGSLYKGYIRFAGAAPELDAVGPYRLDDCFVY